jgi:hypothetical protein
MVVTWPKTEWEDARPPRRSVLIPAGASPAQIVHGYIVAMYHWETAAYQASAEAEKSGLAFDDVAFSSALAEAVEIHDLYCTSKKRVHRRKSIGYPPDFDERLSMISEEYPNPRTCEILTRNVEAERGSSENYEILFKLFKKQGEWRIDSAKYRLVGNQPWEQIIL